MYNICQHVNACFCCGTNWQEAPSRKKTRPADKKGLKALNVCNTAHTAHTRVPHRTQPYSKKGCTEEGAGTLDHNRLPTKSHCSSRSSVVSVAACMYATTAETPNSSTDRRVRYKRNYGTNRKPQQYSAGSVPHTYDVASSSAGGRLVYVALWPAGFRTRPALLMCCLLSVVSGLRT